MNRDDVRRRLIAVLRRGKKKKVKPWEPPWPKLTGEIDFGGRRFEDIVPPVSDGGIFRR